MENGLPRLAHALSRRDARTEVSQSALARIAAGACDLHRQRPQRLAHDVAAHAASNLLLPAVALSGGPETCARARDAVRADRVLRGGDRYSVASALNAPQRLREAQS